MADTKSKKKPLVVAITGGIGSGKTTVANIFSDRYGIPVVDADIVAREVVEPGTPGLESVVDAFTTAVLDQDGQLNRRKLKSIIFANESERTTLERILHPAISREIRRQIFDIEAPYCILGIPLLKKTNDNLKIIDRILVVDCPKEVQIERVTTRDTLTEDEVTAIITTQSSREERLTMADDVLINDGEKADLHIQIDTLHTSYMQLLRKK